MTGRHGFALLLLLAFAAPIAALAAAGGCEDECVPGCGDCGLCLGAAVASAKPPGLEFARIATAVPPHAMRPCGAPCSVPDPVPLPAA